MESRCQALFPATPDREEPDFRRMACAWEAGEIQWAGRDNGWECLNGWGLESSGGIYASDTDGWLGPMPGCRLVHPISWVSPWELGFLAACQL